MLCFLSFNYVFWSWHIWGGSSKLFCSCTLCKLWIHNLHLQVPTFWSGQTKLLFKHWIRFCFKYSLMAGPSYLHMLKHPIIWLWSLITHVFIFLNCTHVVVARKERTLIALSHTLTANIIFHSHTKTFLSHLQKKILVMKPV